MTPFNILKQAAPFCGACGAGRTAIPGDTPTTSGISAEPGLAWVNEVYEGKATTVAGKKSESMKKQNFYGK